jgi:hypothetical protein
MLDKEGRLLLALAVVASRTSKPYGVNFQDERAAVRDILALLKDPTDRLNSWFPVLRDRKAMQDDDERLVAARKLLTFKVGVEIEEHRSLPQGGGYAHQQEVSGQGAARNPSGGGPTNTHSDGDLVLTLQTRKELYNALLSAFPSIADLGRVTFQELGENLSSISAGGNLGEVALNLIVWAGANGRIRDLVIGARTQNKGNATLAAFARTVGLA